MALTMLGEGDLICAVMEKLGIMVRIPRRQFLAWE